MLFFQWIKCVGAREGRKREGEMKCEEEYVERREKKKGVDRKITFKRTLMKLSENM